MPETKSSPGVLYTAGSKVEEIVNFTPTANEYFAFNNLQVLKLGNNQYLTRGSVPIEKEIPDWAVIDVGYLSGNNMPKHDILLGICFPWGGVTSCFPLFFYRKYEGKRENSIITTFHAGLSRELTNRWFNVYYMTYDI